MDSTEYECPAEVRALVRRFEDHYDSYKSTYSEAQVRRDFIDPLHLNRRGAGRLSGEIATALASFRDGAPAPVRWATLEQRSGPLDRPAASEVAMELPHEGDRP